MIAVKLKDKKRFSNIIFDRQIVLSTNGNKKYNSVIVHQHKHKILNMNAKLHMHKKRYLEKVLISKKRLKNQKSIFKGEVFLLDIFNGCNIDKLIKYINSLSLSISGVIINNNYYKDSYKIVLNGDFNASKMLIILLLSLLKMFTLIFRIKLP